MKRINEYKMHYVYESLNGFPKIFKVNILSTFKVKLIKGKSLFFVSDK